MYNIPDELSFISRHFKVIFPSDLNFTNANPRPNYITLVLIKLKVYPNLLFSAGSDHSDGIARRSNYRYHCKRDNIVCGNRNIYPEDIITRCTLNEPTRDNELYFDYVHVIDPALSQQNIENLVAR